MSDPPHTASISLPLAGEALDPELEALPQPRRPGRNLTLVAMALTAVVSLGMALTLRSEAAYALRGGQPEDVGDLTSTTPSAALNNRWVRAEALLGTTGAIRYSRPLDGDTFRLAPVAGNERIWVEIRVPSGLEGPHFVPPTSFVGRLVPLSRAGLRHTGLPSEVRAATGQGLDVDSWLLVDGESPRSLRWALGLVALFVGFAAFNIFGLYRLLRPVRDR